MYSDFLQPCITEPICMITGQVPSIVDNILTNMTIYLISYLLQTSLISRKKQKL